jgi:hypothetical protein
MHLAAFRDIDQPTNRRTIGNRLGQPLCLPTRHELIPGREQFREYEQIGIRLLQLRRYHIKIRSDFPELRIELVEADSHTTLRFIQERAGVVSLPVQNLSCQPTTIGS